MLCTQNESTLVRTVFGQMNTAMLMGFGSVFKNDSFVRQLLHYESIRFSEAYMYARNECAYVRLIMACFPLREFHPHLPDYNYIKVKLCPDANKMMLCYAIS